MGASADGRVFVSYRRGDTGGWAGRVHERLVRALGDDRVFMDVESIEAGEDWKDRLHRELQASALVLVLIGPDWAGERGDGTRRIDDPDDPVAVEIRTAIAAARHAVPVIVGGARVPAAESLPVELRPLLDANAVVLEPSYFDHGIDRLIRLAGGHARRRRRLVGAAVGLVAAAVGIAAGIVAMRGEAPAAPMTGDFNIAVVPFTVVRDGELGGSGDGEPFAEEFAVQLDAELDRLRTAGFRPEIRRPSELEALAGTTAAERIDDAARLAEELEVDLVVFGSIEVSGNTSIVEPAFYLDNRRLFEAAELAGEYRLGRAIESPGDVVANAVAAQQMRTDLADRSAGFVDLVFGLSYYSVRDYATAEAYFRGADGELDDVRGREVVLLFLGDSLGRQRRFDDALDRYTEAISFAPGYARLPLSVAEARFQIVAGASGCRPGEVDDTSLAEVGAAYDTARSSPDQPALADVALRAEFGLARVELCRVNAGLPADLTTAAERLGDVVASYEAGNDRIREVAAEAYGLQALVVLAGPDGTTGAARESAAERYERAAMTAVNDERQAEFERLREQVLAQG